MGRWYMIVGSRCEGRRAECHGPHVGAIFTIGEQSEARP